MAALTAERDTQRRAGNGASYAMAAIKIWAGSLVCISTATGYATKGAAATTLVAVGAAKETVDNSAGAAGDLRISVDREGWFRFGNSASGDLIALDDIGKDCYVVDDQTVALTDATGTRSKAGKIRDVDAQGVWIEFV
ncbi:MAG: hypothetical protein HYX47_10270 [Burkholderiales bacterium]|nr:hypothetical protein [Burkholderiales bacterium]